MLSLDAALAENAAEIEAGLDALLSADRLPGPGVAPQHLIAAMRHGALKGGKRLRPLLVRQTAGIFGVPPRDALFAGLAVELIHCYSLIHDDLPAMDDDDLRRGRPTVHKAFDEATAILAGDGLLTLAFALLEDHAPLVSELAAGAFSMVGGQMRDILAETAPLGLEAVSNMQAMKTGALIRAAVRMGARLGGADAAQLADLTLYGEIIGRAFQLADDLLDVTATPQTMGKATGKDDAKGKQTLVAHLGVDAARRRLGDLVHDAITALTPFGPEADPLRAIARYVATRDN